MIVLIKLILAHLVGDFILQPHSWVKAKEEKRLKAWQLYIHVILHGLLSILLIWNWHFWKYMLFIIGSHLSIDLIKLFMQREKIKRLFFFADQLLHIISICFIGLCYQGLGISFDDGFINESVWILLTSILFLSYPSAIIIKILIAKWSPQTGAEVDESLQNAGKYIGILERLLVFIFIITNHWEAVGFLVTAKSVFRFGDLKESKERKLTEYILIGTLISFGMAILIGILYQKLLSL